MKYPELLLLEGCAEKTRKRGQIWWRYLIPELLIVRSYGKNSNNTTPHRCNTISWLLQVQSIIFPLGFFYTGVEGRAPVRAHLFSGVCSSQLDFTALTKPRAFSFSFFLISSEFILQCLSQCFFHYCPGSLITPLLLRLQLAAHLSLQQCNHVIASAFPSFVVFFLFHTHYLTWRVPGILQNIHQQPF